MKIIAEIGSNFKNLADCLNSISLAKNCGADIVKFQAFDHNALYGWHKYEAGWDLSTNKVIGYARDGDEKHKFKIPGQLPLEWLPQLKAKADSIGIEFMCSAFSPELADEVNKYVSTHKIASAELTHVRLLEKINSFKKPVILSTGASGDRDIDLALTALKDCDVTLLFCVAAYPARYVNFSKMDKLKRFGRKVGFSDHTTDVLNIPRIAQDRGAFVLEKHVNLSGVTDTPDAPHSLSLDEFKAMVQALRNGNAPLDLKEETSMILRHNRRLIVTSEIKAGEVFDETKNFGIFRAMRDMPEALSPWLINQVNGQKALMDHAPGDAVTKTSF